MHDAFQQEIWLLTGQHVREEEISLVLDGVDFRFVNGRCYIFTVDAIPTNGRCLL